MEKYDPRIISRAKQRLGITDFESLDPIQKFVIYSAEERIINEEEKQNNVLMRGIPDEEVIPRIEANLRRLNELPFTHQSEKKRGMLLRIEKFLLVQERERDEAAPYLRPAQLAEMTMSLGSGVARGTIRAKGGFWEAYIEEASKSFLKKLPVYSDKIKDEEIRKLKSEFETLHSQVAEFVELQIENDYYKEALEAKKKENRNSTELSRNLGAQIYDLQEKLENAQIEIDRLREENSALRKQPFFFQSEVNHHL